MLVLLYGPENIKTHPILNEIIPIFKGVDKRIPKWISDELSQVLTTEQLQVIEIDPNDKETLHWLKNNSNQIKIELPTIILKGLNLSASEMRVFEIPSHYYEDQDREMFLLHALNNMPN